MSCISCVYADPRITDDGESTLDCRRNPPLVIVVDNEAQGIWPQVDAEDWCGEHTDAE